MAQDDQRLTTERGAGATEGATIAMSATTKNMQAIAGEIFDISKQSFEHTTQTLDKLRNAHGLDEIVAIQTNFVKEAFENAARHVQRFSQLMTAYPAEISKTYQEAWLKSVNSTVKAMETANQTAAGNADHFSEAARKTSNVFDHRESA